MYKGLCGRNSDSIFVLRISGIHLTCTTHLHHKTATLISMTYIKCSDWVLCVCVSLCPYREPERIYEWYAEISRPKDGEGQYTVNQCVCVQHSLYVF